MARISNRSVLVCVTWVLAFTSNGWGNPDAGQLFEDLLSTYNKLIRPVNMTTDILIVKFKMRLSQLLDVHEKNQIMTTNVWLEHEWYDKKLSWDPNAYGNVTVLYVPAQMIWLPDIVLYNNADGHYQVTIMTKATVTYTGQVNWNPPAIYKSMCHIDVEWFPFDEQTCTMKFGTWTYDGSQVELRHKTNETIVSQFVKEDDLLVECVENGIDLSDYYRSTEWDLLAVPGWKKRKMYPCCQYPFFDITYQIVLRRKTLFYSVNLILPCVGISLLTIIVFYLPSDSGEKIVLSISILISLTVFFLLLVEIIPSTSTVIPLIGKYLLFTMIMVSLSIAITVVVINHHFRGPFTHIMSPWMRRWFLMRLPRLLCMELPSMELDDSTANEDDDTLIYGNEALLARRRHLSSMQMSNEVRDRQTFHFGGNYTKTFGNDQRTYTSYSYHALAAADGRGGASSVLGAGHPPRGPDGKSAHAWQTPSPATTTTDDAFVRLSVKARRTLDNVQFISDYFKQHDHNDQIFQEWRYVGMVIDRIFLILFTVTCVLGTVAIIFQAPSLYDDRVPLESGDQSTISRLNRQAYCSRSSENSSHQKF